MKIIISFIAIVALVYAQSQLAIEEQKCKEDLNCSSNCCLFGQCMPNDFFCQNQISEEEAKPQLDDLKKEINADTGSSFTCDANWQCSSNCCFLGDCRESNFMCKNDKNFGERCSFNSDCNSGCCHNYQCSSYWQCHVSELGITEAQIQEYQENEIDAKTGSPSFCGANWQCPSNCCFMGSCKKSNFTCKNQRNLGDRCALDDDCNSGCCKFGFCSSFFACKFQEMKVTEEQMQENEENEIDLESGSAKHCDANWQCPSNCCFLGSCKKTNFMCQNDKNIGERCAFNDDCNSGCCNFGFCSSYFACHYQQMGVSEAQIQENEENEIDLESGSAKHCDANWQCPSNCCFLGSCKKSNFMCQNDKNIGERCAFNDDCNSGCCNFGFCSSYFACHYQGTNQQITDIAEIKALQSKQASLQLKNQVCGMNWQCSSGCCYHGLCSDQTIMCRNQGELGDICKDDNNCNSGCCVYGLCNPFQLCKLTQSLDGQITSPPTQILDIYQTSEYQQHIKQQVIQAKNEIGLQSTELWGPCDYNFQCSSSCCLDGTCTLFSYSCGNQNATGDVCQKNQDCLSSCCYDDGFTNEKRCSPIEFCTYQKKHSFQHDCKWNSECKSGCCAFGSCRKDMFWCNGQVEEGQDCIFNGDCRSSCCTEGKCSYAMNCYTGKDFLRESNPELMVFYDYLQKFGTKQSSNSEAIIEEEIKLDHQISIPKTTYYNITMINSENQRPWYFYVGIVFGVAMLIFILVQMIINRHKILNICKRRNSMEYSRLIEEEVVGRDRL